jgi:alkylhydroperoxidase/carboxymuconolactone decarboxylase family protein YurZ
MKAEIVEQWLSKHVPAAMNAHATIEELLDAVFSLQSMP